MTTTTPATAPSSVIVKPSTSAPAGPCCSKSSASKSHYKIRKCPLCHKNQTNLLQDLETREKEGNFKRENNSSDPVDKGDHRNLRPVEKESGEGKTPFFKCPLCELVTAYLPTHFANKHKIPRSSEQSGRYMAFARAYEGGEELKYIERTRPSRKMTSVTDARGIECLLQVPLLD